MSNQVTNFLSLNDDVLNEILNYLSLLDIFCVRQTCTRLTAIVDYHLIRRYSTFNYTNELTAENIQIQHMNPNYFEIIARTIAPHIKCLLITPHFANPHGRCVTSLRLESFLKILFKHQTQLHLIIMYNNQNYYKFEKFLSVAYPISFYPKKKKLIICHITIDDEQIQYIYDNWSFQEIYFGRGEYRHHGPCDSGPCIDSTSRHHGSLEWYKRDNTFQYRNSDKFYNYWLSERINSGYCDHFSCQSFYCGYLFRRDFENEKKKYSGSFLANIFGIAKMVLEAPLSMEYFYKFCENNGDTLKYLTISYYSYDYKIDFHRISQLLMNLEELQIRKFPFKSSDLMPIVEFGNLIILNLNGFKTIDNEMLFKLAATNNLKELTIEAKDTNNLNISSNRFNFTKLEKLSTNYTIDNLVLLQIAKLNQSLSHICFEFKLENCDVLVEFVELAVQLKCIRIEFTRVEKNVIERLAIVIQKIDDFLNNVLGDRPKLKIILGNMSSDDYENKKVHLLKVVSMFKHSKNIVLVGRWGKDIVW